MKREFKKRTESAEEFKAKSLIESFDNATDELKDNTHDIESILKVLKSRKLTDKEKETVSGLMETIMRSDSSLLKEI